MKPSLNLDPFANPGVEHRGLPFLSFNGKLEPARLRRSMEVFRQMGLGGATPHTRYGLEDTYLGEHFLDCIRGVVDDANELGLRVCLYDEDRWPSGYAGGLLTKDPAHRAKELVLSPEPIPESEGGDELFKPGPAHHLARYAVRLEDGKLAEYRRLGESETPPDGTVQWFASWRTCERIPSFNGYTYGDTINPASMRRFCELVHDRFLEACGGRFPAHVPYLFSDEPRHDPWHSLPAPDARVRVSIPWTLDLPETYRSALGADPLDTLPEIFWDLPEGRASVHRWRLHEHISERFAAAWADIPADWCGRHGIGLTVHLLAEERLSSQTFFSGEVMRSFRQVQVPGVDQLCDWDDEINTYKQAVSVARQYGRKEVMTELYGVTRWDFPFAGHKRQGDLCAALGATLRVPHLNLMSLRGEAKRDYPASIGEHSPWWPQYHIVEDHFARLHAVLTQGEADCPLAVIHPVESMWLAWGPGNAEERSRLDQRFAALSEWLAHGLIDFDFLAESLLPEQETDARDGVLSVGQARYQTVVVPPMRTIRSTTLAVLEAHVAAGGEVLFLGEAPALVDVAADDRARRLADGRNLPFEKPAVLDALEPLRRFDLRNPNGTRVDGVYSQVRRIGDTRVIFAANHTRDENAKRFPNLTASSPGTWDVSVLDTLTGETRPLPSSVIDDRTEWRADLLLAGSMLVSLTPRRAAESDTPAVSPGWQPALRLAGPVETARDEANVLLLDRPRWRLSDAADWQPADDLLNIDEALRARFGLQPRARGKGVFKGKIQPYVLGEQPSVARVRLLFTLHCADAVAAPHFAMERPEGARLWLDGTEVPAEPDNWWVDPDLRTLPLPDLAPGEHHLEVETNFGPRHELEWMYLLGEFDVELRGEAARLCAPTSARHFGDLTRQGLPFYSGNLSYRIPFDWSGGPARLVLPLYKAPLVTARLDEREVGHLAFEPHRLELGDLPAGPHELELVLWNSRENSHGPLHNADPNHRMEVPHSWRLAPEVYSPEYRITEVGILSGPLLEACDRAAGQG